MNIPAVDKHSIEFPPVDTATPEGLLAVGGDLSADRLLSAYRRGIFPWYNEGQPILWWSPDPRVVLYPQRLKISRSLRKTLRRKQYVVTADRAFREVVQACAGPRPHHPLGETWITAKMMDAYCRLHELGYAHSIECWHGDRLAGGLYGVALGRVFFGESMFSHRTDASKVALVYLTRQLMRLKFALIDCQVSSAHLYSLGAKEISRREFMRQLDDAIAENKHPSCDRWTLEPDSSA